MLDETATSLEVLSDAFVDYPWREFDVVSAPLGSGVAGMEWPGATWIEPSLFVGGIPGLSGLEDLLGGVEGLEGLDDLLGGLGGDLGGMVGGETGRMIETLRGLDDRPRGRPRVVARRRGQRLRPGARRRRAARAVLRLPGAP